MQLNQSQANADKEKMETEHVDYATTSRCKAKGISTHQHELMLHTLRSGKVAVPDHAAMRMLMELNLPMADGRPSADIRRALLAQLLKDTLDAVGPEPCHVIGISLHEDGKESLVDYVRAADIKKCAVGTLAAHLIYLIDVQCEPIFKAMRS